MRPVCIMRERVRGDGRTNRRRRHVEETSLEGSTARGEIAITVSMGCIADESCRSRVQGAPTLLMYALIWPLEGRSLIAALSRKERMQHRPAGIYHDLAIPLNGFLSSMKKALVWLATCCGNSRRHRNLQIGED